MKIYIPLFFVLMIVLQSCMPLGEKLDKELSPFYYYGRGSDKHKVYFCGTAFGDSPKEVKDIDIESFKVISRHWAKDKNAVYRASTRYTNVDAASFLVTAANEDSLSPEHYLLTDKNHVYYIDVSKPEEEWLTIVEHADSHSFAHWGLEGFNRWAKDKNHVYKNWQVFDADPVTFEPMNTRFAKDKDYLYEGERDMQAIKVNTTELVKLGYCYVRTNTDIYFSDSPKLPLTIIPGIKDTASIKVLYANSWLKADGRLYYNGHLYNDADIDAANIHAIGYGYFYDNHNIYFCTWGGKKLLLVKQADAESFQVLGKSYYAKDKNHAYYSDKILQGVNPKEFYYDKGDDYAYSGGNIYRDGELKVRKK